MAPPRPAVAALTWTVVFLAYVWLVFGTPRVSGEMDPVGSRAGVTYLSSVVGTLVLIRLGGALLDDAGSVGFRPALIVVAVRLHFLPFAKVFHPMFVDLGSLMTVLGAVGLVLGWVWNKPAAAASAVVTGIVMLVVIAVDVGRPHGRRG